MSNMINTNITSLNAQNNLTKSQSALATSLQRLSTGLRINSAKDDAAGLAISSRMTSQINGTTQAARNANDAISLTQTADSALGEMTNNLQRVRDLSVQATNSTNSQADRDAINLEVQQRLAEVDRSASQTSFNGQKLLDGSFGSASFQVGANVGESISVDLGTNANMRLTGMGQTAQAVSATLGGNASVGGSNSTGAITSFSFGTAASALKVGSVTVGAGTFDFNNTVSPGDGGKIAATVSATYNFSSVAAGTMLAATSTATVLGSAGTIGTANPITMTGAAMTLKIDGKDITTTGSSASNDLFIGDLNAKLTEAGAGITASIGAGPGTTGAQTITFTRDAGAFGGIAIDAGSAGSVANTAGFTTVAANVSEFDFSSATGTNAEFNVSVDGDVTSTNIKLTTAFKSSAEMLASINTQLATGDTGVTAAFNTTNGELTFTNLANSTNTTAVSIVNVSGGIATSAGTLGVFGASAGTNEQTITASTTGNNTTGAVAMTGDYRANQINLTVGGNDITLSGNYANNDEFVSALNTALGSKGITASIASGSTAAKETGAEAITFTRAAVTYGSAAAQAAQYNAIAVTATGTGATGAGFATTAGAAGNNAFDYSSSRKAQFDVTDGTTSSTITLTQKYADGNEMAAAIQSQFTTDGSGFKAAFSNGKLTISNASATAAAVEIKNADSNATTAGFANTAGTVGVSAGEQVSFKVNGTAVSVTAATTSADAVLEMQGVLDTAGKTNITASYANGKYSFTDSTVGSAAVAITEANGTAINAGFTNTLQGTTGTAANESNEASFKVDGFNVALNANYNDFDKLATEIQTQINSQAGNNVYTVKNTSGSIQITKGTSKEAVAITAGTTPGTADSSGFGANAGIAASVGTNATFTVDGKEVKLASNYAGTTNAEKLTAMQADVQTQLTSAAYTVGTSNGALTFTSKTAGSAAPVIKADTDTANVNTNSATAGIVDDAIGTTGTVGGSVSLANLTINGTQLNGEYATTAKLTEAINSKVSGVFASMTTDGKLSLTSASDIKLGGAEATGSMGFASATALKSADTKSLLNASTTTVAEANATIQRIDSALSSVSTLRSTFGAVQNRFDSVISTLSSTNENLTSARSRIQDADFAVESASLTRGQILQQAGTAMLAQANSLPNGVMALLR